MGMEMCTICYPSQRVNIAILSHVDDIYVFFGLGRGRGGLKMVAMVVCVGGVVVRGA